MNKTKIEWCDSTWNPVTGCLYGCDYCYARRIAKRFTPKEVDNWDDCTQPGGGLHEIRYKGSNGGPWKYGFTPTLHSYRLMEPAQAKKPQKIFVCSMSDLFGEWVSDEWIKQVFAVCELAPQHQYLFLTKNPQRYLALYESKTLPYAENYWFGTTCTSPANEFTYVRNTPYKCFVSIEPILEPFGRLENGHLPDWVIIGAETGDRKEKIIPRREWITEIANICQAEGVPVFMKDSLVPIVGEENMLRQWPEAMTV